MEGKGGGGDQLGRKGGGMTMPSHGTPFPGGGKKRENPFTKRKEKVGTAK